MGCGFFAARLNFFKFAFLSTAQANAQETKTKKNATRKKVSSMRADTQRPDLRGGSGHMWLYRGACLD